MTKRPKPLIDDNGEVRELKAEDDIHVSLLRDDSPELAAWSQAQARGRPRKANAKVNATLRLDPEALDAYKKSGKGWQVRINEILRANMP